MSWVSWPTSSGASETVPSAAPRASDRLDAHAWDTAHARLVESLRALIAIPSINPPDPPGAELEAARWIAAALADAGLRPDLYEPFPGRGSVVARLHGDGTGGEPLLLLSHLDVVPAPPADWTHDPFAGDVADGYVWGRGAVDMKDLTAMELEVVRLLADETRRAGRDPASDPVPGLRRDILFASTADEEAGGHEGIGWLVDHHPEHLRAAGAINESGAVSVTVGDRRLYPIGVAEKGYVVYRIAVRGTWGHGSMPRADNAAVLAARVVAALGALCEERHARVARALVRDTISPDVIHSGIKYNVIPGDAVIELDCRPLPGTTEPEMRAAILERIGPELAAACELEEVMSAPPVEAPLGSELYRVLEATVRDHDPAGVPLPFMVPFATDAKHLERLGVPSYGFSPLRMDPAESYLERFHGVDERVSLDALRWGLPVLYDAVRRFCG